LPIISQPQVAILAVGSIDKRVVVIEDEMTIRPMCYLTLGYDHRLVDGRRRRAVPAVAQIAPRRLRRVVDVDKARPAGHGRTDNRLLADGLQGADSGPQAAESPDGPNPEQDAAHPARGTLNPAPRTRHHEPGTRYTELSVCP
jgi:hypothetical protein